MKVVILMGGLVLWATGIAACVKPVEVYGYRPTIAGEAIPHPESAPIDMYDISDDLDVTYEAYRETLRKNEELGRFTALNRRGTEQAPLVAEIRRFAQQQGADAAIISCASKPFDGKEQRICAGVLLRYE